jgi:hypothetical protein
MPESRDFGYFQIRLRGEEGGYPALIDISSFLYDFNLLYEFSRLVVDPKYVEYKFSRFSSYRNAQRLSSEDRLGVESLHVGSPIEILAIVLAMPSSAGALWAFTQVFEKIANFRINRDILKLQREKLKKELQAPPVQPPAALDTYDGFREQLHTREADYYFGRVEKHLRESAVHVTEFEIGHIRELSREHNSDTKAKS